MSAHNATHEQQQTSLAQNAQPSQLVYTFIILYSTKLDNPSNIVNLP